MKLNNNDLLQVTDHPIVAEKVISRIKGNECGAIVTFIGRVRGYSGDRRVLSLEHEVPKNSAEKILEDIATEIRQKWDLGEIAFCYRSGPVAPGETTAVIAVSATRRPEAFAACQYAIDLFKQSVTAKEICGEGEVWINGKRST